MVYTRLPVPDRTGRRGNSGGYKSSVTQVNYNNYTKKREMDIAKQVD